MGAQRSVVADNLPHSSSLRSHSPTDPNNIFVARFIIRQQRFCAQCLSTVQLYSDGLSLARPQAVLGLCFAQRVATHAVDRGAGGAAWRAGLLAASAALQLLLGLVVAKWGWNVCVCVWGGGQVTPPARRRAGSHTAVEPGG
jgi:hypothetical protein